MKIEFQNQGGTIAAEWERRGKTFSLDLSGKRLAGEILSLAAPDFSVKLEGRILRGSFFAAGDFLDVHLPEGTFRIRFAKAARRAGTGHGPGGLKSPMPGKVIKLAVAAGAAVAKGDLLMILEAMKMEHKILSPFAGIVKKIHYQEGERVSQDVELIDIEEKKAEE